MKSRSDTEETECSCNHLTHFAVLFDYDDANSGVRCTTKITEPRNGLEFCSSTTPPYSQLTITRRNEGGSTKTVGVVHVQNSSSRFGNFCSNLWLGSETVFTARGCYR